MARPRSFDPDDTLEKLKGVFWERGYDGASMSDIEEATGLNKQSLYRHWGDKRGMYLAALQAYARDEMLMASKILSGPEPLRERLEALFYGAAKSGDTRGCFLCNAGIDQAQSDKDTRKAVQSMMRMSLNAFKKALGPGHEDEAATLQAAYQGLNTMAAAGMPRNILMQVARGALARID